MNRTIEFDRKKAPKGQVLLTSCDSLYFNQYAPALFQSAVDANTAVHFNVVNPSSDASQNMLRFGNHPSHANNKITVSFTHTDIPDTSNDSVYYCCDRFLLARDLIALDSKLTVLTIDVDSIIMREVPDLRSVELGLWLRPNESSPGMNLLAGMCLFSNDSLDFVDSAAARMEASGFKTWFDDQKALWDTYLNYSFEGVNFCDFADSPLLDWEFNNGTYIWTGKGNRKHDNKTYVDKYFKMSEKFLRS
jgi:hypothetical protein